MDYVNYINVVQGLEINEKERENIIIAKKLKHVSFEKDQLLEGQMNEKKECTYTKKL
jgi:hypothetical protein